MKRFKAALVLATVLSAVFCLTAMAEEQKNSRLSAPDQPGEEEALNQELWQFAKGTPYEAAERHIEKARKKRQPTSAAEVVLPNGWKIAPAGRQVKVGRLPGEAVYYAGRIVVLNTGYYWKGMEPQEISIVDPASGKVQVLHPGSLFPCAVVAGNEGGGDRDLYISGGYDQKVYRYNNKFKIKKIYELNLDQLNKKYGLNLVKNSKVYAAGLASIDKDHLAVVYMAVGNPSEKAKKGKLLYEHGRLVIFNTNTGSPEPIHNPNTGKDEPWADAGYFPHTVRYLNGKLYVSVLGEDKLNVYDSKGNWQTALKVGKTPQDMCPDPQANWLYVVNTGSDYLSVVDARQDKVLEDQRIYIGKDPVLDASSPKHDVQSNSETFGCGPTSCAVDADRLFVTLAYRNAVGIFAKHDGKLLGYIPTGWYPTKVIPEKGWVAVLSAKGIQPRRPNPKGPQPIYGKCLEDEYVLTLLKGTLGVIPRSLIETNSNTWTRQVEEGAPKNGFNKVMPPIHYVFFIVRENRTYDQVLGDLGKGDGDPFLTIFGKEITPNAHKLANEFVTLDNYYANGEISVLGHSYTTSGYASPFMEWLGNMSYADRYQSYPFGSVPAVCSPKYLWDELEKKKIDYRIYGENYFLYTRAQRIIQESFAPDRDQAKKFYDQFYAQMMQLAANQDRGDEIYNLIPKQPATVEDVAPELLKDDRPARISQLLMGNDSLKDLLQQNKTLRDEFAKLFYHYPTSYRSWDLKYSDLDRVKMWKDDFEAQVAHNHVAQFHYIWLPNDHTAGIDFGSLAPDQFVAQNDAALGIIINTISKSPIWNESLILVTEDDAQNGPDHVDATRTVALAVGPWVKRGAVVKDRYDQLSMLRTIEVLLGLDPLNQNDALAVPMFGIFRDQPDYEHKYNLPKPSDRLVESDKEKYELLRGENP